MAADAPTKANGDSTPAAAVEKTAKPTKPDEEAFKKSLEAAEKEHKAVMAKYVCRRLCTTYIEQPVCGPSPKANPCFL